MSSKTWTIVAFILTGLIAGVLGQYFYPGAEFVPSDLWLMPVFVFLIFLWYRLDSNSLSFRRTRWLSLGIIAIAIVALPYYLFLSRGLKRGLVALGWAVLVFLISGAATVAGEYLVYYGLQIQQSIQVDTTS